MPDHIAQEPTQNTTKPLETEKRTQKSNIWLVAAVVILVLLATVLFFGRNILGISEVGQQETDMNIRLTMSSPQSE